MYNKWQWLQTENWEVPTFYKAKLSHQEESQTVGNVVRDVVQAPSLEFFKMQQDINLSNLVMSYS